MAGIRHGEGPDRICRTVLFRSIPVGARIEGVTILHYLVKFIVELRAIGVELQYSAGVRTSATILLKIELANNILILR